MEQKKIFRYMEHKEGAQQLSVCVCKFVYVCMCVCVCVYVCVMGKEVGWMNRLHDGAV